MNDFVRFHIDPETSEPHIFNHGVSENEVLEILTKPHKASDASGGARKVFGQTRAGRYLCVIFREDVDGVFVITAYDLTNKARKAFRRKRRK